MPKKENPNQDIIKMLTELGNFESEVRRDKFRAIAYRKAVKTLSNVPTRIQSGEEAMKYPGIGKKIGAKIDEFLATGHLRQLDRVHDSVDYHHIHELTKISGIGPAFARRLVDMGIFTINDLRKNTDLLNHHQLIGLKYFDELNERIPRREMRKMERIVTETAADIDKDNVITVCGSYRRGQPDSGDIDVLITNASKRKGPRCFRELIKELMEIEFITDVIAWGEFKFMGICLPNKTGAHRRIDIRYIPHDNYYCGIVYFTGSNVFNQEMRKEALQQGYTLNEYSIRRLGSTGVPGEPLPVNCEEDIFEYIGFPYKPPEDRNW